MDRHELSGATAEALAAAHLADVAIQERYDVDYVSYWFDWGRQRAFCLARGPSREAVDEVHRQAHGNLAAEIIEVDESEVSRFLGGLASHEREVPFEDSAFRAILFTDLVGSTDLTQRMGDDAAMAVLQRHDEIVRGALTQNGGSEVKHTGDGIMASFRSVVGAIRAAVAIQRGFSRAQQDGAMPAGVRIGIAAGEPVAQGVDLFGSTVQLAARLTSKAKPGTVLVASAVRDLALGKGFQFGSTVAARLKGFGEPVRVCEVHWVAEGTSAD